MTKNVFTPDLLAVAALDRNGEIVAMAGASRDGAQMWQIGIRVLPGHQGQGLGANLFVRPSERKMTYGKTDL